MPPLLSDAENRVASTCFVILGKGKPLTTVHAKGRAFVAIPKGQDSGADAADHALETVLASLEDSKAEDIVSLNIAGKSALADYMVVVSGRSNRHVSAICEHLLKDMKGEGFGNARVEGLETGDWVLIDTAISSFMCSVRKSAPSITLKKMWATPDMPEETLH